MPPLMMSTRLWKRRERRSRRLGGRIRRGRRGRRVSWKKFGIKGTMRSSLAFPSTPIPHLPCQSFFFFFFSPVRFAHSLASCLRCSGYYCRFVPVLTRLGCFSLDARTPRFPPSLTVPFHFSVLHALYPCHGLVFARIWSMHDDRRQKLRRNRLHHQPIAFLTLLGNRLSSILHRAAVDRSSRTPPPRALIYAQC